MKLFAILGLLTMLSFEASAQKTLYEVRHPDCFLPKIEAKSEIIKDDGQKIVYLRFEDEIPDFFEIEDKMGSFVSNKEISSREVIFEVPELENFKVKLLSSCNKIMSTTFSKESNDDEPIIVTSEMGKLLQSFIRSKIPLGLFLKEDKSVSFFEKVAFYQRYAMDGTKIHADNFLTESDSLPALEWQDELWGGSGGSGGNTRTDCKCNQITIESFHSEFNVSGDDYSPPYNYSYVGKQLGKDETQYDGKGKGKQWMNLVALGASKWGDIQNEGYKRKKTEEKEYSYLVGDSDQEHGIRGEISVLLLCMNGESLPSHCGCDKKGTFNYRYDTNLRAQAELKSGGFSHSWRKAKAETTDMMVVYCYFSDSKGVQISNIIPINGMANRVVAQCNDAVNPNFKPNLEEFGIDIINLITDENISGESALHQNLLKSFLDVISTSFYDEIVCTNAEKFNSTNGTFNFTLKPNERITLGLVSRSDLFVSGRRSWHSVSSVSSDYSMSVVVNPGITLNNAECCTPWIASYLVGGAFINPKKSPYIQHYKVGSDLHLLSFDEDDPNGLAGDGGGRFVRGERGIMHHPPFNAICDVPINLRKSTSEKSIFDSFRLFGGQVNVYDLTGRSIGKFQLIEGVEQVLLQVNEYVKDNIKVSGIYFVNLTSNGLTYSYKLPVIKQ